MRADRLRKERQGKVEERITGQCFSPLLLLFLLPQSSGFLFFPSGLALVGGCVLEQG